MVSMSNFFYKNQICGPLEYTSLCDNTFASGRFGDRIFIAGNCVFER